MPPPESTPGQLFQPADQRRPAPPRPCRRQLGRGRVARAAGAAVRRSLGPVAEPEQELWTPPGRHGLSPGTAPRAQPPRALALRSRCPRPGGGPACPVARRRRNQRAGGLRWVRAPGAPCRRLPAGPRLSTRLGGRLERARSVSACRFRARVRTWRDRAVGFELGPGRRGWLTPVDPQRTGARRHGSGPAARRGAEGEWVSVAGRRHGDLVGSWVRMRGRRPDGATTPARRTSDELAEAMSRWAPDDSAHGRAGVDRRRVAVPSQGRRRGSRLGSPLWTPWAPRRRGRRRIDRAPGRRPGRESPAPLPPPAAGPQWTMGPTSGAHPVGRSTAAATGGPPIRPSATADQSRRGLERAGEPAWTTRHESSAGRPSPAKAPAVGRKRPIGRGERRSSYGDRSTGVMPAVGSSGPRLGEQAGVTDTDDVTRRRAAPTEGEPVEAPAQPGPGAVQPAAAIIARNGRYACGRPRPSFLRHQIGPHRPTPPTASPPLDRTPSDFTAQAGRAPGWPPAGLRRRRSR